MFKNTGALKLDKLITITYLHVKNEHSSKKLAFLFEISDTCKLLRELRKEFKPTMLLFNALRRVLSTRRWYTNSVLLCLAVLLSVPVPLTVFAKQSPTLASDEIGLLDLPKEGQEVYAQIHRGEPFSHSKDGSVFGNRERLLPLKTRGFYREYTVRTPRVKHRGARRLVCGGFKVSQPEVCYYTADHYASFRKIVP